MRAAILVVLLLAVVGTAYFVMRSRAPQPGVNGAGDLTSDPPTRSSTEGYWTDPLPPGFVEVKADQVKPDFTVATEVVRDGERTFLRFKVHEKNGLLIEGVQVAFQHLMKDPATGRLVPDTAFGEMAHFFRKRPDKPGYAEDDEILTTQEIKRLSDGAVGTGENWTARVVSWARLAKKTS